MRIKGFVGTTLVDYPGKIASVVFVGGCNFSCPCCYNVDLVRNPDDVPDIAEEDILSDLSDRKGFIDGVVVTGGEPTLQPDLLDFLGKLKALGFMVKLDTNGSRPQVLERVLREGLVDFVAMDYKAPINRYGDLAGVQVDTRAIQLSVRLLMGSRVSYEFRTTLHPGLLTPDDVLQIAREIKGARRYVLQPFYGVACLDPTVGLPPKGYLKAFQDALESVKDSFGETLTRGEEY